MVAVLHNIRSEHNVGSIFRTADAAGVQKIYLCGITPTPQDRFGRPVGKISKVALGAETYIPWEQVRSTARLLDKLREDGWTIVALEQCRQSVPLRDVHFSKREQKKLALVVGNEVRGLTPAILRRADEIVEIAMRGRKESLNVAVAFGIAIFSLIR